MLTGENGILTQANKAKESTRRGEVEETIRLAVIENKINKYTGGTIKTKEDVINELVANGKLNSEEVEELETGDIITIGNVTVDFSILKEPKETIPTTESYIGCYADIDGDYNPETGEGIDGIIYADLAVSKSGNWGEYTNSSYAYEAKTGLKKYTISDEEVEGGFGSIKGKVISPLSGTTGTDRFYVMALEDFKKDGNGLFYWYYEAYDNSNSSAEGTSNEFGEGKKNTINMIKNWNDKEYGAQTTTESGKSYIDLWGAIQDGQYNLVQDENDSCKWFVPSKAEWVAFADLVSGTAIGVTGSNYSTYGLSSSLWSSTQSNSSYSYYTDFKDGDQGRWEVNSCRYLRLSTTF